MSRNALFRLHHAYTKQYVCLHLLTPRLHRTKPIGHDHNQTSSEKAESRWFHDDPYLFRFHKRVSTTGSFNANANNDIKQVCKAMGMRKEQYYCV